MKVFALDITECESLSVIYCGSAVFYR